MIDDQLKTTWFMGGFVLCNAQGRSAQEGLRMGELAELVPPVSVAYEGTALKLVGKLSDVAVTLHRLSERLTGDDQAELDQAIKMLNEVIEMMSAIDNAFGRIEKNAEKIINDMADGEVSAFLNKGSEVYMVFGAILRRHQTLNVCNIALNNDKQDFGASVPEAAMDSKNVLLFRTPTAPNRPVRRRAAVRRRR